MGFALLSRQTNIDFAGFRKVAYAISAIFIVVGMIAAAAVKMGKPCLRSKMQIGLVLIALMLAIVKVHPVLLILGGAFAGWLLTRPEQDGDAV